MHKYMVESRASLKFLVMNRKWTLRYTHVIATITTEISGVDQVQNGRL